MGDEQLIPSGIRDVSTLSMGELIGRMGQVPLDQLLVNLVDNVTSDALPHLAEQFHVTGLEGWSLCATDTDRRQLIKRAILLHRRKGTPWAVKEGLKSVGFGGATLSERLPVLVYDGAEIYSGEEEFGAGANWARFSIGLDLGETRGVSSTETALIRAVVDEWKNERSHLNAITFTTTTSDTATISEAATMVAHDTHADVLPWGIRYDGTVLHDSGSVPVYDGAELFDGATDFTGFVVGDLLFDNAWESETLAGRVSATDQQASTVCYDGLTDYNGLLNMGSIRAPLYDAMMTVATKRHYLHNGRRTYGSGKDYDGTQVFNGALDFAPQLTYAGIHTIQEVRV